MQFKVVVFHRGALAHYVVDVTDDRFNAFLQRYDGKPSCTPAKMLSFDRSGMLAGAEEYRDIVNEILQVAEQKMSTAG